jgi:type III pantothenate kinase
MKRGAIDIGNTRCKAGFFDNKGRLQSVEIFSNLSDAIEWLEKQNIAEAMVSDVKGSAKIETANFSIRYLDSSIKLPFNNLYQSPETLGADRVAVMAAASRLYPLQASIVFDIGTCMTIDVLSPENNYMRLKAMQHFTDKLPLSSPEHHHFAMGNTTLSALANGVFCGMLYEIEGYILNVKEQYPDANIILCGGDAHYFEKQLKYKIFADQNLVLIGLYHLLVFND